MVNQAKAENTTAPDDILKSGKIIRLAWLLMKSADAKLTAECDLTYSQFSVLYLIRTFGASSQKNVAACLDLTQAAVSRLTETLERKKYVVRHTNPENRRENQVQMTKLGEKQFTAAIAMLERAEQHLYKGIKKADLQVTLKTLDLLTSRLDPDQASKS